MMRVLLANLYQSLFGNRPTMFLLKLISEEGVKIFWKREILRLCFKQLEREQEFSRNRYRKGFFLNLLPIFVAH